MRRDIAARVVCVLTVGLGACFVPTNVGVRMQAQINDLNATLDDATSGLAEQRQQLDEQMQRAERKIEEMAGTLDALNVAARKTDADFGVQLDRLVREVQELRGMLELSEYRVAEMEKLLKAQDEKLAEAQKKAESKNSGPTSPPPKSKTEPAATAEGMLAEGNRLAKAGKHAEDC